MAPRGRSVTLGIDIVADNKGASRAFAQTRQEAAGLGSELESLALKAGGAFAVYQGYDKLQGAAEAAASLREAQNTSSQVFREANDEVSQFAENAADAYGQSEQMALAAATSFGTLLNNAGFARQESADWSVTLSKLASDLAAFKNLKPEEALAALQSGLAGETEPMRRFGIELTQRELQVDALSLGLDKNITTLTRRQRAEVLLASIMRQSAEQQGQFTREINEYNQQQAVATANAENAEAAFGEGLIPAFTLLEKSIASVSRGFTALPAPLQSVSALLAAGAIATGGLTIGLSTLGPALKTAGSGFVRLAAAAGTSAKSLLVPSSAIESIGRTSESVAPRVGLLTTKLRGVSPAAGAAGIAAVGFGAILYAWADEAQKSQRRAAELAASIDALAAAAEAAGRTVEEQFTGETLVDLWAEGRSGFEKFGLTLDDLRKGLTGTEADFERLIAKAVGKDLDNVEEAGLVKALKIQRDTLIGATEQAENAKDAKKQLGLADDEAAGAADRNTAAIERQKSAMELATEAMEARRDAVTAAWQAEQSHRDAQADRLEALAEVQEAERAAAGDSRENRDALRAVQDANESLADSHRDVTEATEDLNDARKEAAERLEDLRDKVEDLRLSEKRADLDRRQAEADARTALADPRLTGLEKEDAALKAQEAAVEQFRTTQERLDAERELASSTVENDQTVIDAKGRVVEAEERVREAAESVTEAQRRQGEVIQEAKERGRAATQRYENALEREGEAWGELVTLQSGATAGVEAHITKLRELEATLAPDSALAQNIRGRIEDLQAITVGGLVVGGQMSLAAGEAQIPGGGRGNNGVNVNTTIINQGTSQQVNRATKDNIDGHLQKFVEGAR
jgi:hypothetical protein